MTWHEYIPSRRFDDDLCVVCGSEFEAPCHPSLTSNPVGRTLRADCDERHGRWRNGRCAECDRVRMARYRAVPLTGSNG